MMIDNGNNDCNGDGNAGVDNKVQLLFNHFPMSCDPPYLKDFSDTPNYRYIMLKGHFKVI